MKVKLLLFLCLCLFSKTGISGESEKLTFVTSDYAPYALQINDRAHGLIPEILATMFAPDTYQILFVPWKRAELMVANGEAFAAFPYGNNEDRKSQFLFSEPLVNFYPSLFYLKSKFPQGIKWQSLEDLHGFQFVGVRGYQSNQMLENAGILVHRVSTEPHSFNFLLFDRADFTLIDKRVGWHVLKQKLPNKAEQFTSQSNQYIQGTYFLMVSKVYPNSEQHLHYFNSKLKELKSSGVYDNILRIYGQ